MNRDRTLICILQIASLPSHSHVLPHDISPLSFFPETPVTFHSNVHEKRLNRT